ncbi:hypothetical protein MXB_3867 [Myxobolus squamalis]|nr:hypothetical protein MXB_3867 [Myxobolus squamalis]
MANIHKMNEYVNRLVLISRQSKDAKKSAQMWMNEESMINKEGEAPIETICKEREAFESIPCQLYEIVLSFFKNAIMNRNLVNKQETKVVDELTQCFREKPYTKILSILEKAINSTSRLIN